MRIEGGTVLFADSFDGGPAGADRVVGAEAGPDEIGREYGESGSGSKLQWPRGADRLPSGNTLITDSRNSRVVENDRNGSVRRRDSLAGEGGVVQEPDRVSLPANGNCVAEEYGEVPSGRSVEGRSTSNPVAEVGSVVGSWAGLVFHYWVGPFEILAAVVGLAGTVGLVREWWRARGYPLRRRGPPARRRSVTGRWSTHRARLLTSSLSAWWWQRPVWSEGWKRNF